MTNPNPVLAYLEAEFLSRRQKAISATASLDVENEIIRIDAVFPLAENHQVTVRYEFPIGSDDDDEYLFISTSHPAVESVHIPLQSTEA